MTQWGYGLLTFDKKSFSLSSNDFSFFSPFSSLRQTFDFSSIIIQVKEFCQLNIELECLKLKLHTFTLNVDNNSYTSEFFA